MLLPTTFYPVTATVESQLREALRDRYLVERELGAGGMATVFRAQDLRHSRTVAVKVLRPELTAAIGAERFLREIRIAAQLQHSHILTLIDSGEAAGLLYYVMPFVDGESLRTRVARDGALPIADAVRYLRDVADALAYSHQQGIVHRDVKPDNVMITDRHAMVVDFGVALAIGAARDDARMTGTGLSLGSPGYMAPEQVAGDAIDARADVYAFGATAYELLTGRPPFEGTAQAVMSAHVTRTPEPVGKVRRDVPATVAAVVMRCLEKEPDRRYADGAALLQALEASALDAPGRSRSRVALIATASVAVVLGVIAFRAWRTRAQESNAREQLLPSVQELVSESQFEKAFEPAERLLQLLPSDPQARTLWERTSVTASLKSEPLGATVQWTFVNDTSTWRNAGVTPIDSVRIPRAAVRVRIQKAGYRTWEGLRSGGPSTVLLDATNAPNPEMVSVIGGTTAVRLVGLDHLSPVTLQTYQIDRREITNAEYQKFVDAKGYDDPRWWVELTGAASASPPPSQRFLDRTGRPGPSTWEGGQFPTGQGALPVGGVSWYEAAAYARFAGKSLPTAYHWSRASSTGAAAWMIPASNLRGAAARPGSASGMSSFGIYDAAGNVREWCANSDGKGSYYILGGGWSDDTYAFNDAYAQQPFDRAAINGIRLAKYAPSDSTVRRAQVALPRAWRDFAHERPVSPEVFEAYRRMFDYRRSPLAPTVIARDSSAPDWTVERVTYDAGYNGERAMADLYLPRKRNARVQALVLMPGDGGFGVATSDLRTSGVYLDFVVRSGRAIIVPVYKSTYERRDSLATSLPDTSLTYKSHVIMWATDARRALDYLATRSEIDTTRTAYVGVSWGGRLGGLIPALDARFRTVLLFVAGFRMQRTLPEVDPVNYVGRITVPVFMMNARYDDYFPVETAQRPFFQMLGTPADRKKWVVVDGGHSIPRTALIGPALDWLDRYLGPR